MEDWITQLEAAGLRGVSIQAINNWVRRGHVRTKERYGRVLVHRADVLAYLPRKPGPSPKQAGTSKAGKKRGGKK